MNVNIYVVVAVLLCFLQTCVLDQCVTPDNQQSTCISLNNCTILLKAFANPKKAQDYLRKFTCSYDKATWFQVCCPLSLNASFYSDADVNVDNLSDKRYCGYQHRDDYISPNENITLDEFPWLARIKYVLGPGNKEYGICSGSLINPRYVVTSAYCLTQSWQIVSVRLGEYNVLNKTDCLKVPGYDEQECTESIDFDIDEVVIHPFYNFWTDNNDIGLIRLKTNVIYTDYIRPICLPTSSFKSLELNIILYMTSFTMYDNNYYPLKKKSSLTLVDNNMCRNKQTVHEYNMCLKPLTKSNNWHLNCLDVDDGAPAMSSQKNQWVLEGITTERASLCSASQPIILTKISSYLSWIQDNVRLNN